MIYRHKLTIGNSAPYPQFTLYLFTTESYPIQNFDYLYNIMDTKSYFKAVCDCLTEDETPLKESFISTCSGSILDGGEGTTREIEFDTVESNYYVYVLEDNFSIVEEDEVTLIDDGTATWHSHLLQFSIDAGTYESFYFHTKDAQSYADNFDADALRDVFLNTPFAIKYALLHENGTCGYIGDAYAYVEQDYGDILNTFESEYIDWSGTYNYATITVEGEEIYQIIDTVDEPFPTYTQPE